MLTITPLPSHIHPHPSHNNLNRKYSWYDGDSDANLPTVLVKLEKCLCLKEQLCDDKVGTCVHLLLEMLNIIFIAGTVGMSMRIALRGKGGRGRMRGNKFGGQGGRMWLNFIDFYLNHKISEDHKNSHPRSTSLYGLLAEEVGHCMLPYI